MLTLLLHRDSILTIGSRKLITVSPASFFARSILNSSFAIATSISESFPEIWAPPKSRYPRGLDRVIKWEEEFFATRVTLKYRNEVDEVLRLGSYEQVQFVLKRLLPLRRCQTARKYKTSAKEGKCHTQEDGIPEWTKCPLSGEEYQSLLFGTIGEFRPDREDLWNVIQEQINLGHSTSMYYLRHAIIRGDTDALQEMLSRGWHANGPFWAFFMRPLQYCQQVRKSYLSMYRDMTFLGERADRLFHFLNPDLPQDDWIGSSTHKTVYSAYKRQRGQHSWDEWDSRQKSCQEIIRKHGGKISPLVTLLQETSVTTKAWALIIYVLLYAVVIPFTTVYTTAGTWISMSTGQKLGFMYLWAPLAALLSPFLLWDGASESMEVQKSLIWLGYWALLFIINNFVLPVLIIAVNWMPFRGCKSSIENGTINTKCTNYSFLLPLAFATIEVVICCIIAILLD